MKYLALIPIMALTACATPRQVCERDAMQDLLIVTGLIAESEQILERGYAIETRRGTRAGIKICSKTRTGNVGLGYCFDTSAEPEQRPVAVDLKAERAKLESLRAKQQGVANSQPDCVGQLPRAIS